MGHLEMSFIGICLNVTKEAKLPKHVGHRVVLVDASKDTRTKKWGDLPAHVSMLLYSAATVDWNDTSALTPLEGFLPALSGFMMPLDGWRLTVPNAKGELRVEIGGIPKLTTYDPQMKIRPDLLADGPPSRAACFVDIKNGHVGTETFQKAGGSGVYTSWKVETEGPPRLRLQGRDGGDLTMNFAMASDGVDHFPFGIPGAFVLANTTLNATDKENDFVLHYLANDTGIPDKFAKPFPHGEPTDKAMMPAAVFGMTSSCSNSQYP